MLLPTYTLSPLTAAVLRSCTFRPVALLSCLQVVNDSKERINELKALIEQRRVQRAMSGDEDGEDPEEERCKDLIEQVRGRGMDRGQSLWVAKEGLRTCERPEGR